MVRPERSCAAMDFCTSQPLALNDYPMCAMRWLLLFLVILVLIGGGLKRASLRG